MSVGDKWKVDAVGLYVKGIYGAALYSYHPAAIGTILQYLNNLRRSIRSSHTQPLTMWTGLHANHGFQAYVQRTSRSHSTRDTGFSIGLPNFTPRSA